MIYVEVAGCCRIEIAWAYSSTVSKNVRHRRVAVAAKGLPAQAKRLIGSRKATVPAHESELQININYSYRSLFMSTHALLWESSTYALASIRLSVAMSRSGEGTRLWKLIVVPASSFALHFEACYKDGASFVDGRGLRGLVLELLTIEPRQSRDNIRHPPNPTPNIHNYVSAVIWTL
jgi:hypothetical protein